MPEFTMPHRLVIGGIDIPAGATVQVDENGKYGCHEAAPEPTVAFTMPEDFRVNTRGGDLGLRAGDSVFLDHDGRYVPYGTVPPDSSHAVKWPHDFRINTRGGDIFIPTGARIHLSDSDDYEFHLPPE